MIHKYSPIPCALILIASYTASAQTTVTLQPDSTSGKDAMIWYLSSQTTSFGPTNTTNYGDHTSFLAEEWTWSTEPGRSTSLMDFDLTGVAPANVINAELSLFFNTTYWDPMHSQLSGSNECTLQRIVDPWDEQMVTWDNQPGASSTNTVTLPASTSPTQNYLNIDVTALVQDMIDNIGTSHGFMIKMLTPINYRRLVFASSDHLDPNLHPKLEITYESTIGIEEPSDRLGLSLHPNPSDGRAIISWKEFNNATINVRDMRGRVIATKNIIGKQHQLDLGELSTGCYLVHVVTEGYSKVISWVVE